MNCKNSEEIKSYFYKSKCSSSLWSGIEPINIFNRFFFFLLNHHLLIAYYVLRSSRASQLLREVGVVYSPEAWETWSPERMWLDQSHELWLLLGHPGCNGQPLLHYALLNVLLFIMFLELSTTLCINDIFISVRGKEAICQEQQIQLPTGPRQMLLISEQAWKIRSHRNCGKLGAYSSKESGPFICTWLPLLGM